MNRSSAAPPAPVSVPLRVATRAAQLRSRLIGPGPEATRWGWLGPGIITAFAAILRFWHLGFPHKLVFDETYYVKDAYSLLQHGVEMAWPDKPNPGFESGNLNQLLDQAEYVVHPPLGKWMIALGMHFDPASSFFWRLSTAVVGTLAVLMVARIARRLFSSTLLGCVAGILMAVDGEAIVHSRTSLLDNFLMFFALAAFGLILIDRDRTRKRLAERAAALAPTGQMTGWGPSSGPRPFLLAAGVLLGMTCAVKWSGLYFLAVFGIMVVAWDCSARMALGVKRWLLAGVLRDGLKDFLLMVPIAVITYLGSWTGWFLSDKGYNRQWAANTANAGRYPSWVPAPLQSLIDYHLQAWKFHTGLTSPHTYKSNPAGWLLQLRPTSFFYESEPTCGSASCSQAITSLGNPVIWWGAAIALVFVLYKAVMWADWRAWAIVAGYIAGYVPWLMYAHRTIFTFYTIAFTPFVVFALTYGLGLVLGPPGAPPERRKRGLLLVGAVVVLAVLICAFYWPVWTGETIPFWYWQLHMWLPSWV